MIVHGDRYISGQNLQQVAEFVGMQGTGHQQLSPRVLVDRWLTVMRVAQRLIAQYSEEALRERVLPDRDRTLRVLTHHIFRIGELFLETAVDDVIYDVHNMELTEKDTGFTTAAEINSYGDKVIADLEKWQAQLTDASATRQLPTSYGPQSLPDLLERSTWHSAQHVRQIAFVLERLGITPDRPLTDEDVAGLPMPERLFE